ncbi:MAG: HAD family hydrolase [Phycisphaerales bacterium]|nr:HAD family hydrolase [Phycisphaerales bacterium]
MNGIKQRAIVFDLDDTLYPERAYVISGFTAVARAFAVQLGDPTASVRRMMELFDAVDRRLVFNRLAAERGLPNPDRTTSEMVETYRRHQPTMTPYGDVDHTLRRLRATCRLGLITDGRPVAQHGKIDTLRLRDRLDHIIVTDDWGIEFRKPHARAFEEMSRCLGAAAADCTYVGDNPGKDFVGPNQLGWRTIQIVRPDALYGDVPTAPGGEPQLRIHTLFEIT